MGDNLTTHYQKSLSYCIWVIIFWLPLSYESNITIRNMVCLCIPMNTNTGIGILQLINVIWAYWGGLPAYLSWPVLLGRILRRGFLRDDKLTYVPLATSTGLIAPFPLSWLGEQDTVFPLATTWLGTVPVEEGDSESVDIEELAFCDHVIYA